MLQKVLFCEQIFEIEIFVDLHILSSPVSPNPSFNGCSIPVRVSVCCQLYSKTNNNANFKSSIVDVSTHYRKLFFVKIKQAVYVQRGNH